MDEQSTDLTTQRAPTEAAEMTPEQLAEARQYGRLSLVCDLIDKALDVGFLALMAFVLAVPLDRWLAGYFANATARLAVIFLVVTALHMAISFPLSLYSGHVLEHRFGLSRLSFAGWLVRYLKRMALTVGLGLALFVLLFQLIWLVGDGWWLAAAAGFFVISVLLGQLMPVVFLPMFYKVERLDNAELSARMARLAEGTGLSIQGVYRLGLSAETAKANAMLAGLGRTRRVLMGDTLLDQFTPDEIEVIFAHEIGHHVFRHIRKLIVTGVLVSVVGFGVCSQVMLAWSAAHYGVHDAHQMPPATLPLLMFVLTVFGLLLEPVQNAISRGYERQCDRYALDRTGLRAAYVSAFRKLARLNKDDPDPHPLEVFWFHSHPPIRERLAMADE
ncbi:MAG: M48 family metallopeptidase [Pirellulales bacterium]